MSSPRFAAFSELASERTGARQSDVAAFLSFIAEQGRGARIDPARIAARTTIGEDELVELLTLASGEGGLLDSVPQLACPGCGEYHDLEEMASEIAEHGEAECDDCEGTVETLSGLASRERYCLTETADEEAATARGARRTMTVAIISALPLELEQVREQMLKSAATLEDHTVTGGDRYYKTAVSGEYVDWEVFAGFSGATNAQAAATTVSAILGLSPDLTLFVGIAGGIQIQRSGGEVSGPALGDVVAAETVFEYEIGKAAPGGYVQRAIQQHSSNPLRQVATALIVEKRWPERIIPTDSELLAGVDPTASLDPIAAGGKVVADTASDTFRLIREVADRAVAVEMEGSGFLVAVNQFARRVDGMVIRGISDLISDKGLSDVQGWQGQAAANAAAFAFELLARYQPET